MNHIIIIGASYAGLVAANALLNNDPQLNVTIIEAKEDMSGLWTKNLEIMSTDYLGSDRLNIYLDSFVSHVDTKQKNIIVKQYSGNFFELDYSRLILATGSRPRVLKWDDQYFTNAYNLAEVGNHNEIYQKLGNEKLNKIHILGGGKNSILAAELFSKLNKDITIIERDSFIMNRSFDAKFSEMIAGKLKNNHINLKTEETAFFLSGNNQVNIVKTNKNQYETDLVLLGLGVIPNTLLGAKEFALSNEGAYLVDKEQKTNIEGIYAIGDCALIYDENLEAMIYNPSKRTALKSAVIVAQTITNKTIDINLPYEETYITIDDLNVYATGITMRMGLNYHVSVGSVDFENDRTIISLVYNTKNKKILGAQIASTDLKHQELRSLSIAIEEQVNYQDIIKDIKKKFP